MKTMREHFNFTKTVLQNGITLHTKPSDQAVELRILIPIGSAHNTGDILPGTFHFLEHMAFKRSRLFPEKDSFRRYSGLRGAEVNATTKRLHTEFLLSCPKESFSEVLPGFLSMIFHPVFDEADIVLERGAIRSERLSKARWFPGGSEPEQYILSKYLWAAPLTLEQRLGSDENLAAINSERLQKAHTYYLQRSMHVFVIGAEAEMLIPFLEEVKTQDTQPAAVIDPLRWEDKAYRVVHFRDVSRPMLHISAICPPLSRLDERAIGSALQYLNNHVHGPLYELLRSKRGWCYNLNRTAVPFLGTNYLAELIFPMQNLEQVEQWRKEWRQHVEAALQDASRITAEKERRRLAYDAFAHQSDKAIIEAAVTDVEEYGEIISDEQYLRELDIFMTPEYLQRIFAYVFAPEQMGEICLAPQEKK